MKLNSVRCSLPVLGIIAAFCSSESYAGTMGPAAVGAPPRAYVSVFGGGGRSDSIDMSIHGTAFFSPINSIGTLAVDGFGETNRRRVGYIGGHLGYQWSEFLINNFNFITGLAPAVELEGYYLGRGDFRGNDINNNLDILDEHDFNTKFPMTGGIFLTNALMNFDLATYSRWHPFLGLGIGAAVLSIKEATAFQITPPEVTNHFDGDTRDETTTFAGQIKAGLNFDFTQNISLFAEYRWLALASSKFQFGSTLFPHVATTAWTTKFDPQYYNMGSVGLRFSIV